MTTAKYELELIGPFRLYERNKNLTVFECSHAELAGVYLWTVPYNQSHLVYYVGDTGRSFAERFEEHTKEYLSGLYRIYDPDEFARGRKRLVWEGMWKPGTQHRMGEFLFRYGELAPQIHRFLGLFQIFLGPFQGEKRLRRRIEGEIARSLHGQAGVVGEFQEKDIKNYARRRTNELPVIVRVRCSGPVHGLPEELIA